MCEASPVPPQQSVLSILVSFCYATQLTITHCNIIETRPRPARGAATLDLTKQKLLRQPIIRRLLKDVPSLPYLPLIPLSQPLPTHPGNFLTCPLAAFPPPPAPALLPSLTSHESAHPRTQPHCSPPHTLPQSEIPCCFGLAGGGQHTGRGAAQQGEGTPA